MKLATTAACTVLALAPGAVAQLSNIQHVSAVATQMSTSKSGYETFQVGVQFDSGLVEDVYALFGEAGASMVIPPAFQVAAPFGADVGPVRNHTLLRIASLLTRSVVCTDQPRIFPNDA